MRIHKFAELCLDSPFGRVRLVASDRGVVFVGNAGEDSARFERWAQRRLRDADRVATLPALDQASRELCEYFAGDRAKFDVALDWAGTAFQERVWRHIVRIPYGATTTYSAVAAALGAFGADRAVGAANGANVISIIVPCHRVVGTDGALVGYAGGIRTKARLLAHEKKYASQQKLLHAGW